MSAYGDRLHDLRKGAIIIPMVVSFAMLLLWVWRRPLSKKTYLIGLVPLGLAVSLSFFPRIASEYEQHYWLGDQEHSIPWIYNPYNGLAQPGGTYFLVRVKSTELTPFFRGDGDVITLGKAIDYDYGKGGPAPKTACNATPRQLRCEWKSNEFVYYLSAKSDQLPDDPRTLFGSIVTLLNSFEIGAR